MDQQTLNIRREQFRQAKQIHGGLTKLLAAHLAIKFSRLQIPGKSLRLSVYRSAFSKKYPPGLDEEEAELPLWAYPSLNALFMRGLKPACRPISPESTELLCPCDGTVQDMGPIENGRIITVKGIEYTLESLLSNVDRAPFEGGQFAVIFLSPIDCHRVFCPQDGSLLRMTHVPGHRLLVHPPFQRAEFPVYSLNERMVFELVTPLGPCIVVMVAGWGVGNITVPLAPEFKPRSAEIESHEWSPPAPVQRGQWLATFELGSTVVLLTPRAEGVTPLAQMEAKVKYGQPLYRYPS